MSRWPPEDLSERSFEFFCDVWLRVADRKSLGKPDKRKYLLEESNELVAIYVTSVRKLQAKLGT